MTTAAPTSTATVAEELTAFCRAGRNIDAINTLYSRDIVSVESMGNAQMPAETRGLDAIRKKNEWWAANNEVHSAEVGVGEGDKFSVYYKYDITSKPQNKRAIMEEMALYTVKDGKVVREQFFYKTS